MTRARPPVYRWPVYGAGARPPCVAQVRRADIDASTSAPAPGSDAPHPDV